MEKIIEVLEMLGLRTIWLEYSVAKDAAFSLSETSIFS